MKEQVKQIRNLNQFLVPYKYRSCTDVCCTIVSTIYSVAMIILSAVLFNYDHFYKVNFPSDSDGRLCGISQGLEKYPYVYFAHPTQIERRVCVARCPTDKDLSLKCVPTQNVGCFYNNGTEFEVVKYENYQNPTRSGYFCFPEDQNLREKLLQVSNLQNRDMFFKSIDTIRLCFFVSFAFSFAFLLAVQFVKKVNLIVVGLSVCLIVACVVCIITYSTQQDTTKWIQGLVLAFVLIFILLALYRNHEDVQVYQIFLKRSSNFVKNKPIVLAYIPIFMLILFAFIVIFVLQFTAIASSASVTFDPSQITYQLQGEGVVPLLILLAIKVIWGLSFVMMGFNFCISTHAVNWIYGHHCSFFYPFKLLFCKHFGSVVAGSFMNGFFSIGDFVLDTIKPNQSWSRPESKGCKKAYATIFNKLCSGIISIFDFVRSDAVAYIAMTGNPFCNSSRYCQYLCSNSHLTNSSSSQSISRIFRVTGHFFIAGIMVIFALYVNGHGKISMHSLFIVFILALFVSNLFVNLHGDVSQALQITYLFDEEFSKEERRRLAAEKLNNSGMVQGQVIDPQATQKQLNRIKEQIQLFKAKRGINKNK